eukprot:815888_1
MHYGKLEMMRIVKSVSNVSGRMRYSRKAPKVDLHLAEHAFTVSNVRNVDDLEVVAPTMDFQVLEVGPKAYRVQCQPTNMHVVIVRFAENEIARFIVSKRDSAIPAGAKDPEPAVGRAMKTVFENEAHEWVGGSPLVLLSEHRVEPEISYGLGLVHPRRTRQPGVLQNAPGYQFVLTAMPDDHLLEVIAPDLHYSVFKYGTGMIVKYKPTGIHPVEVVYDGKTVRKFHVATVGAYANGPTMGDTCAHALMLDCCCLENASNQKSSSEIHTQ